tara:strand:+ start:52 stop:1113 length:1062 start_codon:yes stop_codon:yes gene_type:complete
MESSNNNKRNNIQKKNQRIKTSDDNSLSLKKVQNSKQMINDIFNKYKILIFTTITLGLFLIIFTILIFWIYNSNLEQNQKLAVLSNKLNAMPEPISQGRLGLIIKKSNDVLRLDINNEISSINEKINDIEDLINTFPRPISEGKIGLIFDKKIQKINSDLEKKIKNNFSSQTSLSSNSKQNEEMINEVKKEFKILQQALKKLSKAIGSVEIENSLTQEISDLKSQNLKDEEPNLKVNINSSSNKNLDRPEEFSLIINQFADYAYKAIKEDIKVNRENGFINSIINNLQLIFVQRSLKPQEGDSVDSILSRAEYALSSKNYEIVFQELNKLPYEASKIMDEWRKNFEVYVENNS